MSNVKLVLFSAGWTEADLILHEKTANLIDTGGLITYIPSSSSPSRDYYEAFKGWYTPFGLTQFSYFAIDTDFTMAELESALDSSAIFLSGGNTFCFLQALKQKDLLSALALFARRGGVLIGQSAGGVIMTPTIEVVGDALEFGDENSVGLKDLSGLNLTSFEFSPHFSGSETAIRSLCSYSEKKPNPVYACSDGAGIIVEGESLSCIGELTIFYRGKIQST